MKLTQKTIGTLALPPGKNEVIVFDEDLPGFGLRLRVGGARTWIYQFKIGSQNRRITLGSVAALAPTRARQTAGEMHAMVRLGRDPANEKLEGRIRASETMSATLTTYLAHQHLRLKNRSYVEVERHLLKYCKLLHALPLAKIDRRAVANRISAIAAHNGAVSANRMRASLSAFFAWTIREGLLDANPVIGTGRQPEKSRERVLTDEELKLIWKSLGSDDYSSVVRLLMLTGQRADEIGALHWSEVVDDRIVLLPNRTKNGREHVVPLAPAALSLLDSRERNGDFVFGRKQGRPFRGWGVCKAALDQRISDAGITLDHWTHHDLRRTMATRLAELGTGPHIIEAVLNHVSGHKAGVAGIYNRATYTREKAIALSKWADHLLDVVDGIKSKTVLAYRATA